MSEFTIQPVIIMNSLQNECDGHSASPGFKVINQQPADLLTITLVDRWCVDV